MTRTIRHSLAAAALAFAATPSSLAAQTTFTTFDAFVAAIGSYGTDSFNELSNDVYAGPLMRSAGTNAYTVQAAGAPFNNLYALANPDQGTDLWLSTEEATAPLRFGGFSNTVFAVGGRFFATGLTGAVSGTALRVVAIDVMGNTVDELITPTSSGAFFGARFAFAVASFTVTADNSGFGGSAYFPTVNDLVLGQAATTVPEPATLWLLAAGVGVLFVLRRKRAA
jgi:hypothetical protein